MANHRARLDGVEIVYDPAAGGFILAVHDSRLPGSIPVRLPSDTPGLSGLIDILVHETGLLPDDTLRRVVHFVPEHFENAVDEYDLSGAPRPIQDTRLIFPLGVLPGDRGLTANLGYAAHTWISGPEAMGQTELLLALAQSAISRKLAVHLFDGSGSRLSARLPELPRSQWSRDPEGIRDHLFRVVLTLRERIEAIEETGSKSSADYESRHSSMAPIFLFLDSADRLSKDGNWDEILQNGARAGIYLFITTPVYEPGALELPTVQDVSIFSFSRFIALDGGYGETAGRGSLRTQGTPPTRVQFLAATPRVQH